MWEESADLFWFPIEIKNKIQLIIDDQKGENRRYYTSIERGTGKGTKWNLDYVLLMKTEEKIESWIWNDSSGVGISGPIYTKYDKELYLTLRRKDWPNE